MKQNTKLSFSGQDIYVGIDTGKKSWKVTIRTEHFEHKTFSQDPRPELLVDYLHRNFPEGNYHCVYEAGYFGFWIYEYLKSQGLDCIVVHASTDQMQESDQIPTEFLWHRTPYGSGQVSLVE